MLSNIRRLSITISVLALAAVRPAGAQSDKEQVLAALDTFFVGLRTKDTVLMLRHVDSATRFTLLRPTRDGGLRVVVYSAREFITNVTAPNQPGIDEPIRNPVVHIDGDLASVWAEYQVIAEGKVSHCGLDAFHMVRKQGAWRILNVSDTFRRTGCGAPWPRPPR